MGNDCSNCTRVPDRDRSNYTRSDAIKPVETTKEKIPPLAGTQTGLVNENKIDATNLTIPVISGDNNTVTINSPEPSTASHQQDRLEFNFQECIATFTGREDFIKEVHEILGYASETTTSSIRSQTIVIIGMAGVGKTQAVRRYIQLYKESYDHVFWINAESYPEALSCFIRLAERIPIEITYNGKKISDEDILDKIYEFLCQKFVLIVFDNVGSFKAEDSKGGLKLLLPQAMKTKWKVPAIIVTTRNRNWTDFRCKELKGFDLRESVSLLSVLNFEDSEDNRRAILEVATLCQGLPLALQQVISLVRTKRQIRVYLDEEPYTLNDFLAEVTSNKKEFISTEPPESASLDVFTIFQMTFEQIVTMKFGPLALQCLDIMSKLNPDNIPTVLIKACFSDVQNELGGALSLLHCNNLVTRCDGFYQVHRMVQAVKIESGNINSPKLSYEKLDLARIVISLSGFLEGLSMNCKQVHEILNNASRIYDDVAPDNYTKEFLIFQEILARALVEVGSYAEAIRLLREAVRRDAKVWGVDHEFTIKSKTYLGRALREEGKYQESETIYSDILQKEIKELGPEHQDTLCTKHNLAAVFKEQGKFEEAEELYREVLEVFTKILGPNHPDTLGTKNNLAGVFEQQGKFKEAQKLLEDVLQIQIQILGPDHPDTLGTEQNLVTVFVSQGNFGAAQNLSNDMLENSIKILGSDHPSTVRTKHNLAAVLQNLAKYEDAQKLYNEVLAKLITTLGVNHPDTLSTKYNLATVLETQGKYEEAQGLYEEVLEVGNKILGLEHPCTLRTKYNLAVTFVSQGKYEDALKLISEVLELRIKILGPDHPVTLGTKQSLALVLDKLGRTWLHRPHMIVRSRENPEKLLE